MAIPLLGLLWAGTASAEIFLGGRVEVSPMPLPKQESGELTTHGYVEYRFRVSNHDTQSPHSITLSFPNATYGPRNSPSIFRLERSVYLEPNTSGIVSIFQPPVPIAGNNEASVTIDRRLQLRTVSFNMLPDHGLLTSGSYGHYGYHGSSTSTLKPHLLVGRKVPPTLREVLRTGKTFDEPEEEEEEEEAGAYGTTGYSAYSSHTVDEFPLGSFLWRSETDTDHWPNHWLSYTRFDAVVLTEAEFAAMTPIVRGTIEDYLRAGGNLTVLGEPELPESWTRDSKESIQEGTRFRLGLGCLTITPDLRKDFASLRSDWENSAELFSSAANDILFDRSEAHDMLPLIDSVGVPLRLVLLLILVFAILIGPVNVLILKRLKRRIWLLWTVPLMAVFFSTIVFFSTFLVEGFQTRSRSRTLTVLDQRAGKAISLGMIGFYAPLTPGGGLNFETNTCLLPVLQDRGGGDRLALDWSTDQNLADGWINSRVPCHFFFRKCDSRKERITVDFSGEQPSAVNGLGIDLDELIVADGEGRIYHATDIVAGEKVVLGETEHRTSLNPETGLHSLRQKQFLRDVRFWGERNHRDEFYEDLLWPGTYFARAERWSPMLEPGLASGSQQDSTTEIFGILEIEMPEPE
jgi:hypothetical protein